MVLSPLSLEAIIKRQRFIKQSLSFSQTLIVGRGRARGSGSLAPSALVLWKWTMTLGFVRVYGLNFHKLSKGRVAMDFSEVALQDLEPSVFWSSAGVRSISWDVP